MITENGTGLPLADSYVTLADLSAYHTARGNTAWAASTDSVRTIAAVRATDFVEAFYKAYDEPLDPLQGLQWPTVDGVPACVKRAVAILALEALNGPLVTRAERGIKQYEENAEGTGGTKTIYDTAPDDLYPHVTLLLSPVAALRSQVPAKSTSGVWVGTVLK
jgi:hypothetical protein